MREQLAALERVEFFLHGADPGAQAGRLSQPFAGAFGVGSGCVDQRQII